MEATQIQKAKGTRMQKGNRPNAHRLRAVESQVLSTRTAGVCKLTVNQTKKDGEKKDSAWPSPGSRQTSLIPAVRDHFRPVARGAAVRNWTSNQENSICGLLQPAEAGFATHGAGVAMSLLRGFAPKVAEQRLLRATFF